MVSGSMLMVVFVIAILFVLIAIIRFRLNPFLALLLTALLTAFMVQMPLTKINDVVATGFGNTLKGIGIVIGLGIVLGQVLAAGGATKQIAHGLLKMVGVHNSPLAVNLTAYLVSIPVFMDAAFVILISLVKQLCRDTKRPLIIFVTALSVGLVVTHALVLPTPGPLAVAANMNLDIGVFLLYALVVAMPAALGGGWLYGLWIGRSYQYNEEQLYASEEEKKIAKQEDDNRDKPSFGLSVFVLLLPILLILCGTIIGLLLPKGSALAGFFGFVGDKNIALLIGVFVAMVAMNRFLTIPLQKVVMEACESSGIILLITGAGGALGNVINSSGIGKYLVDTMSGWHVSLIVLGFVLSQILRAAQGSTTVALITTSSILGPVIVQSGASPILVGLAICAGGIGCSLPNDSGFWVVSRFSNFTVQDTMKSWTAGGTIAGLTALAAIFLLDFFRSVLPGL